MGHGAPKQISNISVEAIVRVIAAQANVEEAFRDMADTLQLIFDGNESPKLWANLTMTRQSLEYRNRILWAAIDSLVKGQQNV